MIYEFKLPDLGEGLTESEIVSWQVAVGDTVELNQVIGEVETAKAVVELPSPYAGVVTAILHEPGATVDVGAVIIAFDVAQDGPDAQTPSSSELASAGEPTKRVPTLVGYGAEPETSNRPVRRSRSLNAAGSEAPPPALPAKVVVQGQQLRSTPPVRKLARDKGIDLSEVAGSGVGGLITREDVLVFTRDPQQEVSNASVSPSCEVRTPIKGVQKFMAEAMVQSAFTAPHVSEFLTVDVTAGMAFLAKMRASNEFKNVKLTPLTLAAMAVCLGIARQPSLNSRWDVVNNEIVSMNYINLGIAAATPRGLLVPNIKEAQSLGLHEMAQALGDLADTARAGKTPPSDLAGGTFSITNIGVFGIDAGTPILNPGEAGILALGAVRNMPWEYQGGIALRQIMTLSLSFDHRLVDGEQGSRFLADVGAVIADPAMALALATQWPRTYI